MNPLSVVSVGLAAVALASCAAGPRSEVLTYGASGGQFAAIERISDSIGQCWTVPGGPLPSYAYTPETAAGAPRILVVPQNDVTGLPKLVIQGDGSAVRVFGPLLGDGGGTRLAGDVKRWAGGDPSC